MYIFNQGKNFSKKLLANQAEVLVNKEENQVYDDVDLTTQTDQFNTRAEMSAKMAHELPSDVLKRYSLNTSARKVDLRPASVTKEMISKAISIWSKSTPFDNLDLVFGRNSKLRGYKLINMMWFATLAISAPAIFMATSAAIITPVAAGAIYMLMLTAQRFHHHLMTQHAHNMYLAETAQGESFVWETDTKGLEINSIFEKVAAANDVAGLTDPEKEARLLFQEVVSKNHSGVGYTDGVATVSYAIEYRDTEKLVKAMDILIGSNLAKLKGMTNESEIESQKDLLGQLKSFRQLIIERSAIAFAGHIGRDHADQWAVELPSKVDIFPPSFFTDVNVDGQQVLATEGLSIRSVGKKNVLIVNSWMKEEQLAELIAHIDGISDEKMPQTAKNAFIEKLQIAFKITHRNAMTEYNDKHFLDGEYGLDIDKRTVGSYTITTNTGFPDGIPHSALYSAISQLDRNPLLLSFNVQNDAQNSGFRDTTHGQTIYSLEVEQRMRLINDMVGDDPTMKALLEKNLLDYTNDGSNLTYKQYSHNYYEMFLQLADPYGAGSFHDAHFTLKMSLLDYVRDDSITREMMQRYLREVNLWGSDRGIGNIHFNGKRVVFDESEAKSGEKVITIEEAMNIAADHQAKVNPDQIRVSKERISEFVKVYKRHHNQAEQAEKLAELMRGLYHNRIMSNDDMAKAANIIAGKYSISPADAFLMINFIKENVNNIEAQTLNSLKVNRGINGAGNTDLQNYVVVKSKGGKKYVDASDFMRVVEYSQNAHISSYGDALAYIKMTPSHVDGSLGNRDKSIKGENTPLTVGDFMSMRNNLSRPTTDQKKGIEIMDQLILEGVVVADKTTGPSDVNIVDAVLYANPDLSREDVEKSLSDAVAQGLLVVTEYKGQNIYSVKDGLTISDLSKRLDDANIKNLDAIKNILSFKVDDDYDFSNLPQKIDVHAMSMVYATVKSDFGAFEGHVYKGASNQAKLGGIANKKNNGGINKVIRQIIEQELRRDISDKTIDEKRIARNKEDRKFDYAFYVMKHGSDEEKAMLKVSQQISDYAVGLRDVSFRNNQEMLEEVNKRATEMLNSGVPANSINLLQIHEQIFREDLDAFEVKLNELLAKQDISDNKKEVIADRIVGDVMENYKWNMYGATGNIMFRSELTRDVRSINRGTELIDNDSEWGQAINKTRADYNEAQQGVNNIKDIKIGKTTVKSGALTDFLDGFIKEKSMFGNDGARNGFFSYQKIGNELSNSIRQVVSGEGKERQFKRTLLGVKKEGDFWGVRLKVADFINTEGYYGGGELTQKYGNRSHELMTYGALVKELGKLGITEDMLKNADNIDEIMVKVDEAIAQVIKMLEYQSELKTSAIEYVQKEYKVKREFAINYVENLFARGYFEPDNANSDVYGEFKVSHHIAEKDLTQIVFPLIFRHPGYSAIIAKDVMARANDSKIVLPKTEQENESIFALTRTPIKQAGKNKSPNFNDMLLGHTPHELVKQNVIGLISRYRTTGGQVPFTVLWENMKQDLMKNTLSTNLDKYRYNGREYDMWLEVDRLAEMMDKMATKGTDFAVENTDLVDRRHNNRQLVGELFNKVMQARLNSFGAPSTSEFYVDDNDELSPEAVDLMKSYILDIMNAPDLLPTYQNASFMTQLDKDNVISQFSNDIGAIYFKPDVVTGDIINSNLAVVQGTQGFGTDYDNDLHKAADVDMNDAKNTMFIAKHYKGFVEAQGCGNVFNLRDDNHMKIARALLDIQQNPASRKTPDLLKQAIVPAVAYSVATGVTAAVTFAVSLMFGPVVAALAAPVIFAGLVWNAVPAMTDKLNQWFKSVNDSEGNPLSINRFQERTQFLGYESSIEDFMQLPSIITSGLISFLSKTEMFNVMPEGAIRVLLGQYQRWNGAKLETPKSFIHFAKIQASIIEKERLSADLFERRIHELEEESVVAKYPNAPLAMYSYATVSSAFLATGISAFGFMTGIIPTVLGMVGSIAVFSALGFASYKAIMGTLDKHQEKLGQNPETVKKAVTRFMSLCSSLMGASIMQMVSDSKLPFIQTEPQEIPEYYSYKDSFLERRDIESFWDRSPALIKEDIQAVERTDFDHEIKEGSSINFLVGKGFLNGRTSKVGVRLDRNSYLAPSKGKLLNVDNYMKEVFADKSGYGQQFVQSALSANGLDMSWSDFSKSVIDADGNIDKLVEQLSNYDATKVTSAYNMMLKKAGKIVGIATQGTLKKADMLKIKHDAELAIATAEISANYSDAEWNVLINDEKLKATFDKEVAALVDNMRKEGMLMKDKEWLSMYFTNVDADLVMFKDMGLDMLGLGGFTKSESGMSGSALSKLKKAGVIEVGMNELYQFTPSKITETTNDQVLSTGLIGSSDKDEILARTEKIKKAIGDVGISFITSGAVAVDAPKVMSDSDFAKVLDATAKKVNALKIKLQNLSNRNVGSAVGGKRKSTKTEDLRKEYKNMKHIEKIRNLPQNMMRLGMVWGGVSAAAFLFINPLMSVAFVGISAVLGYFVLKGKAEMFLNIEEQYERGVQSISSIDGSRPGKQMPKEEKNEVK